MMTNKVDTWKSDIASNLRKVKTFDPQIVGIVPDDTFYILRHVLLFMLIAIINFKLAVDS